jgi:hypothetical protein
MSERTPDLNEQLDRLEALCPPFLSKPLHFLREPGLRWLRLGVGLLLVVAGLMSFLPILGIEMLPVGLILIAIDVPVLRGPIARMIDWLWRLVVWGGPSGRRSPRARARPGGNPAPRGRSKPHRLGCATFDQCL